MQHYLKGFPGRPPPVQFAFVRAAPGAHRQLDVVVGQVAQHGVERAEPVEEVEDQPHRRAGLLVGFEDHLPRRPAPVADGQRQGQLAALGFGQPPARHPLPDQVQLTLGHGALEPQQQAVVVVAGVIDAVGVGEQGLRQRAQLDQLVPVAAGAGQPGHLDPQHQADPAHRHLGDQPGEPRPGVGHRRRGAQVVVDDLHLRARPAQGHRPRYQRVLHPGRLGVLEDLLPAGLPDVDDRRPVPMLWADPVLRPTPRRRRGDHRPRSCSPPPASPSPRAGAPPSPASRRGASAISAAGGLDVLIGHTPSFPVSSTATRRRPTKAASRSSASRLIIGLPAVGVPFSGALWVVD